MPVTESETEADKTDRLRSLYLDVTGGDTDPVVEPQQPDSTSREIHVERAEEALGPAELHGLDDAIDDPDPSSA